MNSVVSFDSSKLTPFVHENELKEMQAMVNAADKELREGTGAGNDFRGWPCQLTMTRTNSPASRRLPRRSKATLTF